MSNPRDDIETMIDSDNLEGITRKAGELHGHFCPLLSLGVRAGYLAVKKLQSKAKGMEKVLAIVETNSCFSDGVQMVTGCTFGNNSLIYEDLGKTAFTLTRRDEKGMRIVVKPEFGHLLKERYPQYSKLLEKVITQRKGSEQEKIEMMEFGEKVCFDLLKIEAGKIFKMERVEVEIPLYAPIFESVICSQCKESLMKSRAMVKNGKIMCITCGGDKYYQLDGGGITEIEEEDD